MKIRRTLWLALALTFFVPIFSALYMNFLRAKFARELPAEWEQVTNNGSFAVASPLLITARNIEEGRYAMKVHQAYLHGFPYDPYTGDRSLKSWVFDCLSFYPLVPFVALAGGNIDWGWVLAQGFFSALWVLSFYFVFLRYGMKYLQSLLCALLAFFFIDSFCALLNVPATSIQSIPRLCFLILAYACGQVQWIRLPSPGMTALFSFWVLAWAYRLGVAPSRKIVAATALGITAGLLCFSHPYEWILAVGGLGAFLFIATSLGLPKYGKHNLIWATVVAGMLSAAYFFFSRSLTHPIMSDIIERVGDAPRIEWGAYIHFLWLALFLYKAQRESGEKRWLWAMWSAIQAVVCASFVLPWILHYDLQFNPHEKRFGDVAIVLALFCWISEWRRTDRLWTYARIAIIFVFYQVFFREKTWADTHYKIFGTPRHIEEALQWTNAHTPEGSLFVSLSVVAIQELALNTQARFLVTDGAPSYGSPVPTEQLVLGLATTLKTTRADPDVFLRTRWYNFETKDTLDQQTAYFTRNVCLPCIEDSKWPEFLFNFGAFKPGLNERYAPEILKYYKEENPASAPFYLWLDKADVPLVKKMPDSYGGKLVYENPQVRIYAFKD